MAGMSALATSDRDALEASLKLWRQRLGSATAQEHRARRRVAVAKAKVNRRVSQLKALPRTPTRGEKLVVAAKADAAAGVHEIPNGSNWGGKVATYLQSAGFGAAPWCGAAYRYWAKLAGFDISSRALYVPYIVADARAARNGFKRWIPIGSQLRVPAGSAVIMDFGGSSDEGEHVGALRVATLANASQFKTVEGNTSPGDSGSQDNGQGVYLRTRPRGVILGFAVPA